MEKKTIRIIMQISLLVVFAVVALGSAEANYPSSSSSSGSYSSPSYSPPPLQRTDFPTQTVCSSCQGRKGYYVFDVWNVCKRCNGTGIEPQR